MGNTLQVSGVCVTAANNLSMLIGMSLAEAYLLTSHKLTVSVLTCCKVALQIILELFEKNDADVNFIKMK